MGTPVIKLDGPSEIYRDADTLGRLLTTLGAKQESLDTVDTAKTEALESMAQPRDTTRSTGTESTESATGLPGSAKTETTLSLFKVGDLVSLRSDSSLFLPILEVILGGGEPRHQVFQNNVKATYYESQLQAVSAAEEARKTLTVNELHAHLTSLKVLSPSTANLFSLRLGRIKFIPYQYRPVLKLIRADRPRLLIADEVGVGKTIEAGLIIKGLRARGGGGGGHQFNIDYLPKSVGGGTETALRNEAVRRTIYSSGRATISSLPE